MSSVFELLFDTYGDHLMQEQAPYDEAEIQAALDRMSMPQDMQIQEMCIRDRGSRSTGMRLSVRKLAM